MNIIGMRGGSMSTFRRRLLFIHENQFIKFEDPNAEKLCLKYFDTDNKGRISFDDLKQAAKVGEIFRTDELCAKIVKFNEFKFFGVKTLYSIPFLKFVSLEEIELPSTLEDTGSRTFCYIYMNKIKKLIIPEGVKNIGELCFMGALAPNTTITIPSSVDFIGDDAFSWQKGITFIFKGVIPPTINGYWGNSRSEKENKRVVGYAPDESITLYKNSPIIGKMCSDILPISQYNE